MSTWLQIILQGWQKASTWREQKFSFSSHNICHWVLVFSWVTASAGSIFTTLCPLWLSCYPPGVLCTQSSLVLHPCCCSFISSICMGYYYLCILCRDWQFTDYCESYHWSYFFLTISEYQLVVFLSYTISGWIHILSVYCAMCVSV